MDYIQKKERRWGERKEIGRKEKKDHTSLHVVRIIPWTVTLQAPLSLEFSKQEYWNGLTFPPPGYLPNPGIKPASPTSLALAAKFFTIEPSGNPNIWIPRRNSLLLYPYSV